MAVLALVSTSASVSISAPEIFCLIQIPIEEVFSLDRIMRYLIDSVEAEQECDSVHVTAAHTTVAKREQR